MCSEKGCVGHVIAWSMSFIYENDDEVVRKERDEHEESRPWGGGGGTTARRARGDNTIIQNAATTADTKAPSSRQPEEALSRRARAETGEEKELEGGSSRKREIILRDACAKMFGVKSLHQPPGQRSWHGLRRRKIERGQAREGRERRVYEGDGGRENDKRKRVLSLQGAETTAHERPQPKPWHNSANAPEDKDRERYEGSQSFP
ncbi:hypothetical protein DFH08DRAFT_826878 [Mycena albidolilacea]|uniref:Uncharacterized protein n=1 Tax=Mycena albidolilacea TaxID=1033008 RepID=A0AAD7E7V1_9AGAR|nr:hypothetical protein DFH08DRAFT_826878 [Mycena albidolilacea]